VPGLNFTGVTTTSTAASPSIQHNTTCLGLRKWLSSDVPEGSALLFPKHPDVLCPWEFSNGSPAGYADFASQNSGP
jgi:hypothetical protein